MDTNRVAWEIASRKHVREYDELLAAARQGGSLTAVEHELLDPLLAATPAVVHLQSGHGLDDIDLVRGGARHVTGVDFSSVAAAAAQRRATELDMPCHYTVSVLPGAPLADSSADLVYTGKGALIWMPDLGAWARDAARLLRPGGHLFIFEGHPAPSLWSWDADRPRIRADRSYFGPRHVNDSFPANGAIEWQWTLGRIVTALVEAGLRIQHLGEHPEPFWRMGGVTAAAWDGRLPNTFSLLAAKPIHSV